LALLAAVAECEVVVAAARAGPVAWLAATATATAAALVTTCAKQTQKAAET
jgi:hypothetical protein